MYQIARWKLFIYASSTHIIPIDLIVASVLLIKIYIFLPFPKPLAVQITDP